MIRRDAWHIVHPETGAAIWQGGGRWCWQDFDQPRLFTRVAAEQLLADRPARWRDDIAELVRAPHCGCCGSLTGGGTWKTPLALIRIRTGEHRCERHVGRIPCCIDGCGRTFAAGADGYDQQIICGPHWRQAPRTMRDAVARVRRKARRHGWTVELRERHHRLWSRTVRAVREGQRLDETEINALFGWAA